MSRTELFGTVISFLLLFPLSCATFVFVGFPLAFMNSRTLQRMLIFTTFNLPRKRKYFEKYQISNIGLKNFYVNVKDKHTTAVISLGVWHLLPHNLSNTVTATETFDFEEALKNSKNDVLLYFHGTGEARSYTLDKCNIFRRFFHVITFDYRSYGDSTRAELSEDAVVDDCVQLYEWLTHQTSAPIFIWGHSLGTALATRTVALLKSKPEIVKPAGLVLEAPFTKLSDIIRVHQYTKIFAWLPWLEATILKPLQKNGFIFDTKKNILRVDCPLMILTAEDDHIVPYHFGQELYEIVKSGEPVKMPMYHQFSYNLGYKHNYILRDPGFPDLIKSFQQYARK